MLSGNSWHWLISWISDIGRMLMLKGIRVCGHHYMNGMYLTIVGKMRFSSDSVQWWWLMLWWRWCGELKHEASVPLGVPPLGCSSPVEVPHWHLGNWCMMNMNDHDPGAGRDAVHEDLYILWCVEAGNIVSIDVVSDAFLPRAALGDQADVVTAYHQHARSNENMNIWFFQQQSHSHKR